MKEEKCCSFGITGETLVNQAIYICSTCQTSSSSSEPSNLCCCTHCAEICHDGHEVEFIAYGEAYCDCSKTNTCQLYSSFSSSDILNPSAFKPAINRPPSNYFSAHQITPYSLTSLDMTQLQAECKKLTLSTKDTFWIGGNEAPSCAFERMALSIFHYHLQLLHINADQCDNSKSGAEWWIQYKTIRASNQASNREGSIDLHYDKDEDVASKYGIGIFPFLSTVTYLNASESSVTPTIVLENTASTAVGNPISQCYLSYPSLGKHIVFAGDMLHGAPIELLLPNSFSSSSSSSSLPLSNERITFLVNIWIDHHPTSISRLPLSLAPEIHENLNLELQPALNPISSIKIRRKQMLDDKQGSFLSIPFVSKASNWGIDSSEAALYLKIWLPLFAAEESQCPNGATLHFMYANASAPGAYLEYEDEDENEDEDALGNNSAYCFEASNK